MNAGPERSAAIVEALASSEADYVPAGAKLAGAKFANFSGFLSTQWRANDWWWGRTDAAARITDFLSGAGHDPAGLRPVAAPSARAMASAVAAQRTEESGGDADLTPGFGGLARLDPHYRYSVAAQLARTATRALTTVRSAVGRVMLFLALVVLRPLLVLLPAAVDLPRLLVSVLVVVAGVTLATSGPSAMEAMPSLLIVGFIALASIIWASIGFGDASIRWRAVADAKITDDLRGFVDARRNLAYRRAVGRAAVSLACFAFGWVALVTGAITLAVIWIIAGVAAAGLTGPTARKVVLPGLPRSSWWQRIALALALALMVVAALRQYLGLGPEEFWWPDALIRPPVGPQTWVLLGLALSAFVLASDATRRGLASLVVAAAATAAAALCVWWTVGNETWVIVLMWCAAIVVWANVIWFGTSVMNLVPLRPRQSWPKMGNGTFAGKRDPSATIEPDR